MGSGRAAVSKPEVLDAVTPSTMPLESRANVWSSLGLVEEGLRCQLVGPERPLRVYSHQKSGQLLFGTVFGTVHIQTVLFVSELYSVNITTCVTISAPIGQK